MSDNPSEARILQTIRSGVGTPWPKVSWMQYLRWASNMEAVWHGSPAAAEASLDAADRWGEVVDRRRILFQDQTS